MLATPLSNSCPEPLATNVSWPDSRGSSSSTGMPTTNREAAHLTRPSSRVSSAGGRTAPDRHSPRRSRRSRSEASSGASCAVIAAGAAMASSVSRPEGSSLVARMFLSFRIFSGPVLAADLVACRYPKWPQRPAGPLPPGCSALQAGHSLRAGHDPDTGETFVVFSNTCAGTGPCSEPSRCSNPASLPSRCARPCASGRRACCPSRARRRKSGEAALDLQKLHTHTAAVVTPTGCHVIT